MKLDYSKTINEQLKAFNYYKDRYSQYELQIINLQQENKELKKQLSDRDERLTRLRNNAEKHARRELFLENQQKEFIEYLTNIIGKLECEDIDDEELKGYMLQRIDTFKEILSKYKEIIGDVEYE